MAESARTVIWLGLLAFVVWLAVCALGFWQGQQPNPVLIGLVVGTVAAVLGLALEVSARNGPTDWDPEAPEALRAPGQDARTAMLARVLNTHLVGREVGSGLHDHLVRVLDDRLLARRGVTWSADPDRAAGWIEPDLHRFLSQTSPYLRLGPDQIDTLIDRIEEV